MQPSAFGFPALPPVAPLMMDPMTVHRMLGMGQGSSGSFGVGNLSNHPMQPNLALAPKREEEEEEEEEEQEEEDDSREKKGSSSSSSSPSRLLSESVSYILYVVSTYITYFSISQ